MLIYDETSSVRLPVSLAPRSVYPVILRHYAYAYTDAKGACHKRASRSFSRRAPLPAYICIYTSLNQPTTIHSALCIYILHIYILTRVYISYNLNRCVGVAVVLDVTTLQIHCYCCCVACAARTRAVST